MSDKKILIAYYSYSGNTKSIAEKIQKITGGDIFEIKSVQEYPRNYTDMVNLAKREQQEDIKPELVDSGDVTEYDTIFIGTPIWWYTFASPVRTFLTAHDFSGKTLIPFCTHGGGGEASTFTDIQNTCPDSDVKKGVSCYENMIKDEDLKSWIKESM